jgi:hypothetical protein
MRLIKQRQGVEKFLCNNYILIRVINAFTQGLGDHEVLRPVTKLGKEVFLENGLFMGK